jgi:hypothetical protein
MSLCAASTVPQRLGGAFGLTPAAWPQLRFQSCKERRLLNPGCSAMLADRAHFKKWENVMNKQVRRVRPPETDTRPERASRKKDGKEKALNKTGAQRKGRGRQKPNKPGPNEVEGGAGRGAAKSKHAAKLAAGSRTSEPKKAAPKRILAGTTTRSGDIQRSKSSPRRSPGDLTNQIVSKSRQGIHDRLNQAAATATGFDTAGNKQSDADAGAESYQGRFAGATTTVTNHPFILFVQVPVCLVINLSGLQLRLIHHPCAAVFNPFTCGAIGVPCCRLLHMRSLFRPPSKGKVQNWR